MTDTAIKAAMDVLDSHIAALNTGDEAQLAATMHFPHFRLSGACLKIWETPDAYFSDFRARAGDNWARSAFTDIHVTEASTDKVHLDLTVKRFDADNALIASFPSLWVITLETGHWAAKFRSSFAET